jgi:hypothetical protein
MQVIHATRYSFAGSDGKNIAGAKITYLGEKVASATEKGIQAITVSAPEEVFHQLPQNLPAEVDLKIAVVMSKGEPKAKCLGVVQK